MELACTPSNKGYRDELQEVTDQLNCVSIHRQPASKRIQETKTPASAARPRTQRRTSCGAENEPASKLSFTPSRLNCLGQLQDEFSCSICLDICTRPCTTTCGHSFCRSCLRKALRHSRSCPKCRDQLPTTWQLKVNTALWNSIQLLFPTHAAAAPPVTPEDADWPLGRNGRPTAAGGGGLGRGSGRQVPRHRQVAAALQAREQFRLPRRMVDVSGLTQPDQDEDADIARAIEASLLDDLLQSPEPRAQPRRNVARPQQQSRQARLPESFGALQPVVQAPAVPAPSRAVNPFVRVAQRQSQGSQVQLQHTTIDLSGVTAHTQRSSQMPDSPFWHQRRRHPRPPGAAPTTAGPAAVEPVAGAAGATAAAAGAGGVHAGAQSSDDIEDDLEGADLEFVNRINRMLEEELEENPRPPVAQRGVRSRQQAWWGQAGSSSSRRRGGSSNHGSGPEDWGPRERGSGLASVVRRARRAVLLSDGSDEELELLVEPVGGVAPAAAAAAPALTGFRRDSEDASDDFDRLFGQVHGDDSPVPNRAAAGAAAAGGGLGAAAGGGLTGGAADLFQGLGAGLHEEPEDVELDISEASSPANPTLLPMQAETVEGPLLQPPQQQQQEADPLVSLIIGTTAAEHIGSQGGQQQQQGCYSGRSRNVDQTSISSREVTSHCSSPGTSSSSGMPLQVLSLAPSPEPLHLRLRRAGGPPGHDTESGAAAAAGSSAAHIPHRTCKEARLDESGFLVQPGSGISSQDVRILSALGGRSSSSRHGTGAEGGLAKTQPVNLHHQQQQQQERESSSVVVTASQRDAGILRALRGDVDPHGASSGAVAAPAASARLGTVHHVSDSSSSGGSRLTIAGARAVPRSSAAGLSAAAAAAAAGHQGVRGAGAGHQKRPGLRHYATVSARGAAGREVVESTQQEQQPQQEGSLAQQGLPARGVIEVRGDGEGDRSDDDFEMSSGRRRGLRHGVAARAGAQGTVAGAAGGQRSQKVVSGLRRTRAAGIPVAAQQ